MISEQMQGIPTPRPLFVRLLEAQAIATAWDHGHFTVERDFEEGRLRRWSLLDGRNSLHELGRHDPALGMELERLGLLLGGSGEITGEKEDEPGHDQQDSHEEQEALPRVVEDEHPHE
jgi:hypothetical protein